MARFIILIVVIALTAFIKYQPWIDITREGDVIIWYNCKGGRTYKFLFNIYFKK